MLIRSHDINIQQTLLLESVFMKEQPAKTTVSKDSRNSINRHYNGILRIVLVKDCYFAIGAGSLMYYMSPNKQDAQFIISIICIYLTACIFFVRDGLIAIRNRRNVCWPPPSTLSSVAFYFRILSVSQIPSILEIRSLYFPPTRLVLKIIMGATLRKVAFWICFKGRLYFLTTGISLANTYESNMQ